MFKVCVNNGCWYVLKFKSGFMESLDHKQTYLHIKMIEINLKMKSLANKLNFKTNNLIRYKLSLKQLILRLSIFVYATTLIRESTQTFSVDLS